MRPAIRKQFSRNCERELKSESASESESALQWGKGKKEEREGGGTSSKRCQFATLRCGLWTRSLRVWNSLTRAPKGVKLGEGTRGRGKGEIKKNLTYIHHVFASYIIDLVPLGDALLPVILAALLQRCQTLRNGAGLGDCALIGAHYLPEREGEEEGQIK